MKKIEQGCTALIIKSTVPCNIGLSVTVGKYLGTLEAFTGKDRWQIDRGLQTITVSGVLSDIVRHATEDQLMRIDDFEESQEDHTTDEITTNENEHNTERA